MAKSCTPPSNTTSGEATTIVDPLVDNNGPKQHANKRHGWHVAKKATILVIARLNLRLRIQKRKLLLSDIFMVAAWISGLITAAFSPVFAVLDAFDPSVHTTLKGYHGGSANLVLILKVFPEFMVKRLRFLWATIWDLRPSRTCPKWTYAVTFHVGWGLSFLGDLLDVNIGLVVACLPSLRPYFGSRTKSQEPSRESNSWESTRKHSGFGNRTICFHSKQRGSEAWPSSSGSHARYSSIDQTVVGSWDDTKGFKDANDIELRDLPGARTRDVKYGK
ncbi:hypothetical protein FOXG_15743 [Fusarium oxysporum f. sp. lycopersici 4287]|uniref:Integral membrane protein n=2 Tax=Fusarium oxysporum TaxID=5507 RepID=A0A0J9WUN8_FUSO4|nr:hypothetical protein FOXG_15743 [Fusarium oxysporum f. sp. lycopersici 4287]KNB18107.1 hypothetical protein FOXG_15743 [Fusarium oxysporum f. sp. lycopersici 4287]